MHGKKYITHVMKIKDLKIGRLSWTIYVGPIKSHEPLKAEKLPWLESDSAEEEAEEMPALPRPRAAQSRVLEEELPLI